MDTKAEVPAEGVKVAPEVEMVEKIWTSKIEKTKAGWQWSVYEKGERIAGDIIQTKKAAQEQINSLIDYYKKTTRGQELLALAKPAPAEKTRQRRRKISSSTKEEKRTIQT